MMKSSEEDYMMVNVFSQRDYQCLKRNAGIKFYTQSKCKSETELLLSEQCTIREIDTINPDKQHSLFTQDHFIFVTTSKITILMNRSKT